MSSFHRHRTPRPPRIAITTTDPVADVTTLRPMVERLVDKVQTLSSEVGHLRAELAALRGKDGPSKDDSDAVAAKPPTSDDDVVGEAVQLQHAFDLLQEQADALWFEQQWLSAEICVARGQFGPHGPTVTSV